MVDTYKHKGMRKQLVEIVRKKGIQDEAILNAIEKIPRHLFMDSSFLIWIFQMKVLLKYCRITSWAWQ